MANNNVYIEFLRSDNKRFTIGTGSWRILSDGLQGIDFPNFSVYSEKNAVGDNAILSGKRVDDRDIQIEARSINPANNRSIRDATIKFFNPKYSFKLYITYLGVTRWIEGELSGFKCPAENIHRPMKLTVKFYCADGFLRSVDDYGRDIASISPGFGFPYMEATSPLIPVYASLYDFNREVTLVNDGDVVTYPRVTIDFTGNVVNPKVYKDSYYIRVLGTFVSGDEVEVDFENCTIYKNGENISQLVDRASSFTDMGLDPGGSIFGFDADDGDAYMTVYVYYNKLYLGL